MSTAVETRTTTVVPTEDAKNYGMAFGIVVLVFLLIILILVGILVSQGYDGWAAATNTSTGQGFVWGRTSGGNVRQTLTSGEMRFALWSDGYAYVINTATGLRRKNESDSGQVSELTANQMKFSNNFLELWNTNANGTQVGVAAATWTTPPENDGPIQLSLLPSGDLYFTTNNFSTPVVWQQASEARARPLK